MLDRIKAARDAAREAYRAAGVGADAAGVGADAAGAEAAGAKAGAEAGAKAESMFSRARKAFQPKPGILNPNISGEGIMKGLSKARVLGAPLLAYDLGTTAYDIANTPTDVIRKYYGYTDEPSFLGDVAARSRAALGSLVPFSSTSEGIRALRQQRATGAQQSIPTQTVADTDDTEMGAAMQNKIRGVAPAPAPTQKPAVAARTAPTTTQEKPKTATEANDEVTNYFNKLLNSKSKYDPKKMGEDYKAILDEKMPSQAKDIREFYKAEGERLKGEGDKDRWLALAMGGFAIAAGKSPYAIQNFGEGLGLAAKEISAVNKEMRAAERERQKAERAELAADRAQEAGKFKEAKSMEMEGIKLREMEDQHRAQAANWLSSHKDRMAQIASQAQTAREQIQSHEKIAAMQQARAERQNALLNEYNARVLKGDAPGAKALLPSIEALATATGKGAGGERNDITASKTLLDSINKQAEFIAYHPTLKPDQKTKKLEELEQQRQQIQNDITNVQANIAQSQLQLNK